jgi:sugar phosphate isomerase/epimerase
MENQRPDGLRHQTEKTMNLKLACADFAFPLLSHDHALDLIAMLEFDGVDIGLFEGRSHLHPSQVFKAPAKSGAALGSKLADRNLRCADVFLQTDPSFVKYAANHPEAARRRKARDWFLKTLDYAAATKSKHVTALPGVYFDDEKPAASWERCCTELAWRVDQARQYRLVFGIEAHIGSIVPTPKAALRLVRDVPCLTLTLDYTHFTRCGLPDSAAEPLIAHASHFHARGARKGRLQTTLQHNTIDYKRILRVMNKTGYRGYVGVEYVWIDWEHCNEVDNLSETIQLRDFLRAQTAA